LEIIAGVFLFFFSIPLMFFGERRSVRTKEQIEKAFIVCTHVLASSSTDSLKNNELIFAEGVTKVDNILRDDYINCEFTNTVKLQRVVEVLQY